MASAAALSSPSNRREMSSRNGSWTWSIGRLSIGDSVASRRDATARALTPASAVAVACPLDGECLAQRLAAPVSSARAATCETPRASASSMPVSSWNSASSSAWRWRWRDGSPGRARARPTVGRAARVSSADAASPRDFARPRHEAHDLAPAQLIERRAAGDLVQPRARAVGIGRACRRRDTP